MINSYKILWKTVEGLKAANGDKLQIRYKLPNAVIQNNQIQIKTPFLLIKNIMLDVILGIPFINLLEPYTTSRKDISANILGTTVSFKFAKKI